MKTRTKIQRQTQKLLNLQICYCLPVIYCYSPLFIASTQFLYEYVFSFYLTVALLIMTKAINNTLFKFNGQILYNFFLAIPIIFTAT